MIPQDPTPATAKELARFFVLVEDAAKEGAIPEADAVALVETIGAEPDRGRLLAALADLRGHWLRLEDHPLLMVRAMALRDQLRGGAA